MNMQNRHDAKVQTLNNQPHWQWNSSSQTDWSSSLKHLLTPITRQDIQFPGFRWNVSWSTCCYIGVVRRKWIRVANWAVGAVIRPFIKRSILNKCIYMSKTKRILYMRNLIHMKLPTVIIYFFRHNKVRPSAVKYLVLTVFVYISFSDPSTRNVTVKMMRIVGISS